ncbi:hypothetical protein SAMN02745121_01179 [Nannocystis exedens]|uniref:Uncharacterized protein n=1 Tax=Nannocystis exedens TaxID=54 RepID=A0A1I1UJV5_9BACT|nr:hypothetical protein [Nannocystis exedens]PCC71636.1 hypothetical protein NAEX_04713 [Nannocystis exedens]SFD69033.1 hypothetical protein SAMN02745121_01179 [Nannocystis exedens]
MAQAKKKSKQATAEAEKKAKKAKISASAQTDNHRRGTGRIATGWFNLGRTAAKKAAKKPAARAKKAAATAARKADKTAAAGADRTTKKLGAKSKADKKACAGGTGGRHGGGRTRCPKRFGPGYGQPTAPTSSQRAFSAT